MTSAWLLIQKFYHGELMGIPVVRWAAFLTLTLVVFLTLRVLVTAVRSRLKARSVLTEPKLNDYLLQLLERTWTLSLLAGSALVALSFVGLRAAEVAGESGVEGTVRLLALLLIFVQIGVWGTSLIDTALHRGFRYANFTETAAQTAFGVVRFFALVALWTCVTILVLSALRRGGHAAVGRPGGGRNRRGLCLAEDPRRHLLLGSHRARPSLRGR